MNFTTRFILETFIVFLVFVGAQIGIYDLFNQTYQIEFRISLLGSFVEFDNYLTLCNYKIDEV